MSEIKDIEDHTRRLIGEISPYLKEHNEIDCQLYDFEFVADIVNKAIAEEREDCKAVCINVLEQSVSASSEYKVGRQMGAEVCFNEIDRRGQT